MKKTVLFFLVIILFSPGFSQTSISKNFPGIKKIQVEAGFLPVEVTGGDANLVSLQGKIEGDPDDYQIRYDVNGSNLKIWLEKPGFSFRMGSVKGFIKLQVPNDIAYNIETSSGKLEVSNLTASNMRFATTSGSMTARNLAGSGKLVSTSGGVRFSDSKGDFAVISTSGSIRTNGYNGKLKTTSSSGSSYFDAIKGNIKAISSSGSINLEHVEARLDLKSSSGSIRGDMITIEQDSRFVTSSGSIKLDLTNNLEQVSFDCTSGSGRIKIGSMAKGKTVVLNNGGPRITAVSSSGGQQYY